MAAVVLMTILLALITTESEELSIDGTDSLFVHSENQLSFTTNNPDTYSLCLFYNFNDISNHLYCVSDPKHTECHTLNNQHYTFHNISFCEAPHTHNPSQLPIMGRFTDTFICTVDYSICCKLDTAECVINSNPDNTDYSLLIPLTNDGFLQFKTDTFQMHCIGTNNPKCDTIPQIISTELTLFDAIFISDTHLLLLFTDNLYSTVLIQKCTVFKSNPKCKKLSEISLTNDGTNNVNVIAYNECNILLSINGHTYLQLYNHCSDRIYAIDTNAIIDDNIHNTLQTYIAQYRIPNMDNNFNAKTCFINLESVSENEFMFILNCLLISLETISSPSMAPTVTPTMQYSNPNRNLNKNGVSTNVNANNINSETKTTNPNGLGPFSDASFITIVIVGGIVIVSCLVCAVVCWTKLQKAKIRQEWYKERQLRKEKMRHRRRSKIIIPPSGVRNSSETSMCSNTFVTSTNGITAFTDSQCEDSTISALKLSSHKSKFNSNKKRLNSASSVSSFIRAIAYPRLALQKNKSIDTEKQPSSPPGKGSLTDILSRYRRKLEPDNRGRQTSITHRSSQSMSLSNKYEQKEGTIETKNTDALNCTYSVGDITPLDLDQPNNLVIAEKDSKKSKQLCPDRTTTTTGTSLSTDTSTLTHSHFTQSSSSSSSYGESSESSETIEYYHSNPDQTRPSLQYSGTLDGSDSNDELEIESINFAPESEVMSRRSFDENETKENSQLMPFNLRIIPKITRRKRKMKTSVSNCRYSTVETNDGMDSDDTELENTFKSVMNLEQTNSDKNNEKRFKFKRTQTIKPMSKCNGKRLQKYDLSTSTTVDSFQL